MTSPLHPCSRCGIRRQLHSGRRDLCRDCKSVEQGRTSRTVALESPAVLRDGRWVNDHGVQRWQANGLRLVRT